MINLLFFNYPSTTFILHNVQTSSRVHTITYIRGAGDPFRGGGGIDRIWNLTIYRHLGLRIRGFLFKISDGVELNHGDKSTFTKIFQ
jgi:hypothetical protein